MGDTKIKIHHRVRLVEPVRNMYFLTLKGQLENFASAQVSSRSGPGQIMTQVGQYAHLPNRLDELSRLAPFARLHLHHVVTYWRKTYCDLISPQVICL